MERIAPAIRYRRTVPPEPNCPFHRGRGGFSPSFYPRNYREEYVGTVLQSEKCRHFSSSRTVPLVHASLLCGCPPKKRFHFMWHEMECLGVCLYETSIMSRNHFFFFSIWRVNFTSACLSWKSCFLVRILENFSKYLASISPSWMRVRDSADAAAS